ncbi:MAG: TonB-dependent receptor [Bacteroidota bacterium]
MKTILYFALLLFSINIVAQNGHLKGLVSNSEGKPAEFVSLKLKELQKGTTTNEKGEFSINNLQPGHYTLIASFVGFKTLEQKVIIELEKTTGIALELFENSELLKEIIVKGYVNANEKVTSIGKLPIKAMDLPQSFAVIDRQMIDNQQIKSMSDVLANANGMYIMGTTGGYQEEIAGRGFSLGSTNTFRNGVRYFNGMMSDFSNIEKVEILKGSSAILFGNVAAGGIINLVTKKPKFEFGGEVSMKVGSFGQAKPYLDIYSGIGKKQNIAFRLNGSYEKANSFRKGVSSERYYINPSVLVKLGKKTEILVETNLSNDERTPDFGAGIINYEIVELPRDRFLGVAWSNFKANQLSTNVIISHSLSDNWKLNLTAASRKYETSLFANTRPNSGTMINKEGMWIRNIQKTDVIDQYNLAQLDLTGTFKILNTNHQVLIGAETDQFDTKTTAYSQVARYDTVNIFGSKTYKTRNDIPNMTIATITNAPINRFGVYVQDLISLNKYLKVLAGVRYSYQQTDSEVLTAATNKTVVSKNYDGAFSPRLGVVVQPNKNLSIFGSYANSFALNTGVDVEGNALKPSLTDQIELGIKKQMLNNQLSLNVTAYQIINDNLAQISLANGNTNTNIKELVGKVASKGLEIDLMARPIQNLTLAAGYSYNETKYVKSNTYVEGSLLKYNPNHTANLSANYSISNGKLNGLNIGLIGLYFGDRQAGRSTRVQVANDSYKLIDIPSYQQIDATLGYKFKKVTLGAKMGNLFDVYNYNVHDDNSVNPIAPHNYSASIALKF